MPFPNCRPPKGVKVHGYDRAGPKRKRRAAVATKPYWIVEDGHGHTCGHEHRTMSGAVACEKRKEKTERNLRARYGKGHMRRTWRLKRVTP